MFLGFCSGRVEFELFCYMPDCVYFLHVLREINLVHVAFLDECVVEGVGCGKVVP
jgi:hypothetical protein